MRQPFPVDIRKETGYNIPNFIGQFATILSVNKTRIFQMGALRLFCFLGAYCAHFFISQVIL